MNPKPAPPHTPPEVWGPHFWKTIHYVALGSPGTPSATDRRAYAAWIAGIPALLPCQVCSDHFAALVRRMPPTEAHLAGPEPFFLYTVALHNAVNRQLGKPELPPDAALRELLDPGHEEERRARHHRVAAILFLMAALSALACRCVCRR